jgi:hypothetical protein
LPLASSISKQLGLPLRLARYLRRDDPPSAQAEALAAVAGSNYVVAGPGSPTYALEQLRGTPLLAAMLERWHAGAQLVFASAASVALGRHALPVYEIYKVGQALHWVAGLDILGPLGFEVAIIPHWDNAEAVPRHAGLLHGNGALRPAPGAPAADSHRSGHRRTHGGYLDLAAGEATVRGKGSIPVLRGAEALRFEAGNAFRLARLRPSGGSETTSRQVAASLDPKRPESIRRAAARIGDGDLPGGLRLAAEDAPPDVAALFLQAAAAAQGAQAGHGELGPLLQILIELRSALRERGEWALADGLRQRLLDVGFELRDTPQGTVWARTG